MLHVPGTWPKGATRRSAKSAALLVLIAVLPPLLACANFSVLHTTTSAPDLTDSASAALPPSFDGNVLVLVLWEKFEYVYGEGGERREGFVMAPPRVLDRSELSQIGRLTKSQRLSRKTRPDTDDGTWERGHRPHGLLLISSTGLLERFLAQDDPPRDFEVAWRHHSSQQLSTESASALAAALACSTLSESAVSDAEACSLDPFAEFFTTDAMDYHDPDEKVTVTFDLDAERTAAARDFLAAIDLRR